MQDDLKSRAKKRLLDLLKGAVSGAVVAAASLIPTTAEAAPAPAPAAETTLEERVQDLREQNGVNGNQADTPEEATLGGHFHNWGNHWNNWGNWDNWHNWHNHHH